MCGTHCLKTWSKTQAIVAKSSGEAELYAVIKGAAEALGMVTLGMDLGKRMEIQLHIDAMAAKGMIERKGLSKVRHLDVNVLWLQEKCARKILPVYKVPGEDNPADLMTKHLVSPKIIKNIKALRMRQVDGRADKAAQLHALGRESSGDSMQWWDMASDKLMDRKGGDKWKTAGEGGVWRRLHLKPRRSLFTPYKVSKGPCSSDRLGRIRFTKGITRSGQEFEFHDNWQDPLTAHRLLDEHWIGCTTFIDEAKVDLLAIQLTRSSTRKPLDNVGAKIAWNDILADE